MKTTINGVEVTHNGVDIEEIEAALSYIKGKYGQIESLEMTAEGEFVDLKYTFKKVPFDRIRRITGYLVGSLDKWNGGKQAEEHDRVKHNLGIERLGEE